jgi:hypothetical protein
MRRAQASGARHRFGRFALGGAEQELPAYGDALRSAKDLLRITSKRRGFNRPIHTAELGIV